MSFFEVQTTQAICETMKMTQNPNAWKVKMGCTYARDKGPAQSKVKSLAITWMELNGGM